MKPGRKKPHNTYVVGMLAGTVLLVIGAIVLWTLPGTLTITYTSNSDALASGAESVLEESLVPKTTHLPTPDPLKAIYMTSWVAGTPDFRDSLIRLIDETELNAIVIDIKDVTGKISFAVDDSLLQEIGSGENRIPDIVGLIEMLHEKDIYVIGRVSVFQDPYLAALWPDKAVQRSPEGDIWTDHKGISWLDAGSIDVWDYTVAIAQEAYDKGFDEINLDYVRFPSDGDMDEIFYPISEERVQADPDNGKAQVIESFFAYFSENMADSGAVLSADLFGMTTTNTDDLNIGQILERALPYFDYIMPMVYPSHYPNGFIDLPNPAATPYDVIKFSLDEAIKRIDSLTQATTTPQEIRSKVSRAQIRPWLQDFDLGAIYTPELVRAQIQATYDAGLTSWSLWDAGNTYTRDALLIP